jgi:hypothetical protein
LRWAPVAAGQFCKCRGATGEAPLAAFRQLLQPPGRAHTTTWATSLSLHAIKASSHSCSTSRFSSIALLPPTCRWHNAQGNSPLASLPSEVLRTITHKAGKEARLVCTALRHAFATPGAGVHLPLADPQQPQEPRSDTTERLDTRIARWPYPQGVTKLAADGPLARSTCAAIGATFPALQELSLPGWADGAHAALPPGLCSLEMCAVIPAPRSYRSSDFTMCNLEDVAAHFIGLRSLSLSACPVRHMREVGLSALSRLTQLSALTLTTAPDNRWGHLFRIFPPDYPTAGTGLGLEVWATLGALPRLARLCLDVPLEYHSDMPQVAPLPALTHLALRCTAGMVQRDERRGVQVPVLQVATHVCTALHTSLRQHLQGPGIVVLSSALSVMLQAADKCLGALPYRSAAVQERCCTGVLLYRSAATIPGLKQGHPYRSQVPHGTCARGRCSRGYPTAAVHGSVVLLITLPLSPPPPARNECKWLVG